MRWTIAATGQATSPMTQNAYGTPTMADDAIRLLDHLSASIMLMSWAIRWVPVSRHFAGLAYPERIRSCVLSGLGIGLVKGVGAPGPIAEALLAPSLEEAIDERSGADVPGLCGSDRQ